MDAISGTDAWAVGCCTKHSSPVSHWDGTTWQAVAVPEDTTELYDVDHESSTDVWAVGRNQVMRWDGAQWTVSFSLPDSRWSGVSVLSANNVWVTGGVYDGRTQVIIVLHWNGHKWSQTTLVTSDSRATAVSAVASNDVWVVTHLSTVGNIWHWDGTRWQPIPSPDPEFVPKRVDARSTNDVWFVGGNGQSHDAETVHWDGARLTVVPCPHPNPESDLVDVSAVSATDVWAVGTTDRTGFDYRGLTLHWNGTSWSRVKAPYAGPHATELVGVSAVAGDDAWTVGYRYAHRRRAINQVIGHWDGTAWTRVR